MQVSPEQALIMSPDEAKFIAECAADVPGADIEAVRLSASGVVATNGTSLAVLAASAAEPKAKEPHAFVRRKALLGAAMLARKCKAVLVWSEAEGLEVQVRSRRGQALLFEERIAAVELTAVDDPAWVDWRHILYQQPTPAPGPFILAEGILRQATNFAKLCGGLVSMEPASPVSPIVFSSSSEAGDFTLLAMPMNPEP